MQWHNTNTQTSMLKMNAGEQSFNHMPFTIDFIHELPVQNKIQTNSTQAYLVET